MQVLTPRAIHHIILLYEMDCWHEKLDIVTVTLVIIFSAQSHWLLITYKLSQWVPEHNGLFHAPHDITNMILIVIV